MDAPLIDHRPFRPHFLGKVELVEQEDIPHALRVRLPRAAIMLANPPKLNQQQCTAVVRRRGGGIIIIFFLVQEIFEIQALAVWRAVSETERVA